MPHLPHCHSSCPATAPTDPGVATGPATATGGGGPGAGEEASAAADWAIGEDQGGGEGWSQQNWWEGGRTAPQFSPRLEAFGLKLN